MSTQRILSEPEAWREIARRIAEGEWREWGLCYEVHILEGDGVLSGIVSDDMHDRASGHAESSPERWQYTPYGGFFAYRAGQESEARILAALWLALEAENDP